MIEVCRNCQEIFKARGTKRKFCCRSCYYSSIRKKAAKNRVCGHCKKRFHVPPKEVKKGGGI